MSSSASRFLKCLFLISSASNLWTWDRFPYFCLHSSVPSHRWENPPGKNLPRLWSQHFCIDNTNRLTLLASPSTKVSFKFAWFSTRLRQSSHPPEKIRKSPPYQLEAWFQVPLIYCKGNTQVENSYIIKQKNEISPPEIQRIKKCNQPTRSRFKYVHPPQIVQHPNLQGKL